VPYKNSPQSISDIAAGHVNMAFAEAGASVPLIKDGKLRALAVSSAVRLPTIADVPPFREVSDDPEFEAVSWHALFARAARLGRVDIKRPAKVIGTNTVTHLQSGLYYGYIGLVDGILERIFAELGQKPRVIATGGLAHMVAADSHYITEIDDLLTLDGLRILFERNRAPRQRNRPR